LIADEPLEGPNDPAPGAPIGRRPVFFWPPWSPLEPLLVLINRLIDSEPWARQTLAPFAGQVARLEIKPLVVTIEITTGGQLKPAANDAAADLSMSVAPAHLASIAMAPAKARNFVEITGNTELAAALSKLLEHLRPDVEEGLSRIFGDVLAMRIVAGMNAVRDDLREAGVRLSDNLAEYLLEESDGLIRPNEIEMLAAKLRVLRDDLARLEKRVDRLAPGA
jgi:ubiquinone biosynthesis protein UbiJ